jgi:predicted TIM-barrel fold metal-dependent hydrolase
MIDSHMHLFTQLTPEFPRGTHELYPAERTAELDEYLMFADQLNIDHSILVSLDEHDEYIAQALEQDPGRFSAVAVMDVNAEDPTSDFQRRIDCIPLVGYRLWTLGANPSLVVPQKFNDLLSAMEKNNVAAWFYSDEVQLRALAGIVDRYPNLTFVLNHMGFCQSAITCDEWGRPRVKTDIPPRTQAVVEELARHDNVVVMFSGHYAFSNEQYPYLDLLETSDRLLQAFGPNRLLWASDWPWIKVQPGYRPIMDVVRVQLPGLSEVEITQILGANSKRVLGIKVKQK